VIAVALVTPKHHNISPGQFVSLPTGHQFQAPSLTSEVLPGTAGMGNPNEMGASRDLYPFDVQTADWVGQ